MSMKKFLLQIYSVLDYQMCLYIPLIAGYFCEFHLHRSILSHMAKHPD